MQRTELSFHQGPRLSMVFVENFDHPVDVKVNFLLGEVKVFDRTDAYSAELFSQLCLNQKMEWDRGFFEELKESFELASMEYDTENGEVFLSVPSKRTNECLLRCKIKKVLGRDRAQMLFEYMQKYNEQERVAKRTL